MEEEKEKVYARIVRNVLIAFGIIIGLIMLFVVTALEESFSRAEQRDEHMKQLHTEGSSSRNSVTLWTTTSLSATSSAASTKTETEMES